MARVYDPQKESADLGFGSVLSGQRRLRLLNRDGSFNVQRARFGVMERLAGFQSLIAMGWTRFFVTIAAAYLGTNLVFALLYLLCGQGSLVGEGPGHSAFARALFFSVETLSTIGYGNIIPVGFAANLLMMSEALAGLLGVGLTAGLTYARFARPTARIVFSKKAVVAPYRGITGFEFRIMNGRPSELIEVNARIVLSRFEAIDGKRQRIYHTLLLERPSVAFFPLSWTVVHPIDETSPVFGWSSEDLHAAEAEFLILLTGIDETFGQTVHSRTSYAAHEIVWNARFVTMFEEHAGELGFRPHRLHQVEILDNAQTGSVAAD